MSGYGLRAPVFGALLAVVTCAVPAMAQASGPVSVRGEAIIGYQHFLAANTFEGIFGSANQAVYGGGVDVGLWKHIFVRVDATRFNKTGERAFASNGVVYTLGIPLTVTITPITFAAGYRAPISKTISLYAGGGGGSWSYSESTDDPSESVSFRKSGFVGLAGVEWRFQKYLAVGFEGQYASVSNALTGGVADQLNEHNLGGSTAAFRFIVGR